jgi:cyanophycin synthetase
MQAVGIAQNPPPLQWTFPAQWRVLPGVAHGVRQPVLLGEWHCNFATLHDFSPLDKAMQAGIAEPLPAALAAGQDARSLLLRMLFWAGAVQRQCKVPVFASAAVWQDASGPGHVWRLALPFAVPQASHAALAWVSSQVQAQLRMPAPSTTLEPTIAAALDALGRALKPWQLPAFNTIRFLAAAHAMDMPTRCVVPGVHAFGQGRHSRWLESSYTDQTPVIGSRIARDKFKTAQVLRASGLPAPTHAYATSATMAVQIARQLRYPVVVKPADRDQGMGVSADLQDDAQVSAAYAHARTYSSQILVEKHFHGQDYRITVMNGRMIKAVVRRPAGIVGDGRQTIAQRVAQMRADPVHARDGAQRGHDLIALDTEALGLLSQLGMTEQTVPAAGVFVPLRRRANISAGGTPALVTAQVHPDNQRLAERCARALGLDLAGIDLILDDIGRSWLETGALVCEVNGQPQLGAGLTPGIYQEVLRQLQPGPSRIPVALIVGTSDSDTGPALVRIGSTDTAPWGLASAAGVWQGTERLAPGRNDGFDAACVLAASRDIAAAVIVMAPQEILHCGLPFDRIDVLVLDRPAQAAQWDEADLQAMWRMVLPHVAHGVVAHAPATDWRPSAALLAQTGVQWQDVDEGGPALLQAIVARMNA